jgi:hypothetical protein
LEKIEKSTRLRFSKAQRFVSTNYGVQASDRGKLLAVQIVSDGANWLIAAKA